MVLLELWFLADSVSGVVLGVGRFTIAVVTLTVLLGLLLIGGSIAFRLERDELLIVGSRI